MSADKDRFVIADFLETKGYGTKYNPATIRKEYEAMQKQSLYVKEILHRLAVKYHKTPARIKQIVRG